MNQPPYRDKPNDREDEFLRAVTDLSPLFMYVYDTAAGRAVWVNRRIPPSLGYPAQAFALDGDFLADAMHPEDYRRLPALFARWETVADDTVLETEYRLRHADGSWRWFLGHDRVFRRDLDGKVSQFVGTAQDITDRKQVEEALRHSEEFLNATGSVAKVGGWEVDLRTGALRWTAETFRIHELPTDRQPTVEEAIRFYHPEDREALRTVVDRGLRDGTPWDSEFRLITARGNEIWTRSIGFPEVENGEILRVLGTFQDITERKKAQAELDFSHMVLRKIGDAIMVFEVGGAEALDPKIVYVNEAFEAAVGRPASEILGRNPNFLRGPRTDRPTLERIRQAALRREAIRADLQIYRKDGSDLWVELDMLPVTLPGGTSTHFVAVLRDITERLALDKKLRETQKIESLGLLAGGLAHDFNNLLTSVMGYASLSASLVPEDSPVKEFLAEIEHSGRRAAELCQHLLAYSGRGKVVVGPIHLSKLIEECVRLVRLSLSKKATLVPRLAGELPSVVGDASQFRQIVMNLVMNASDAIGDRDGVISISTGSRHFDRDELRGATFGDELHPGDYIYLEVADTGCGMDSATRARIFDPFFSTKPTGRGLGMAAVLGIVKAHHGSIRVESEPGAGSRFMLLFPPGEPTPLAAAENRLPARSGAGLILVVDDEEIVRNLAVRMVRNLGYQTLEAGDGQEALDMVEKQGSLLRAVMLDMTMPRLDGKEAYAAIRKLYPTLPILIMSGYSAAEVTTNFSDRQFTGFLQKPYTHRDLSEGLERLLK